MLAAEDAMPEISRFYGIVVKMFFTDDERDSPHIHALYGEYVSAIDVLTGQPMKGDLPGKAVKLVQEWLDIHRDELLAIWQSQEFKKLPPLV
jgi:hypothetical protein